MDKIKQEIIKEEYRYCKALSQMHTNKWYVPQWDEITEKVIFVVSDYPKCVGMDVTSFNYECYELPDDAELLVICYQIIP